MTTAERRAALAAHIDATQAALEASGATALKGRKAERQRVRSANLNPMPASSGGRNRAARRHYRGEGASSAQPRAAFWDGPFYLWGVARFLEQKARAERRGAPDGLARQDAERLAAGKGGA